MHKSNTRLLLFRCSLWYYISHPFVALKVCRDDVANPTREDLGLLGVGDGLGDLTGTHGAPLKATIRRERGAGEA